MVGLAATPAAAALTAPTDLMTAGQPCATDAPGPYLSPDRLNDARAVVLKGAFTGADEGAELQADFQVWDITDPGHPQQWLTGVGERNNEVYIQLEDDSRQLDGVTYAWRVRVLDGDTATPWSGTCHFTLDRTGGPAPTVDSPEYPSGGWDRPGGAIGVPGVFTLTSASPDTVSYRYQFYASEMSEQAPAGTVAANGLGGPATVEWTPQSAGYHSVEVYAIDRAGNYSERNIYEYVVRETRPSIFSAAYPDWGTNLDYNVGVPGAFELRSNVADTASFAWRIDGGGPSGTVPAASDGTATAMIAPTRAGRQTLYVHSVTRDGTAHAPRAYEFLVDNGPRLTGDVDRGVTIGSSLNFHLAPRAPQVQAYVYWVEYLGLEPRPIEKITIPARADGTADFTWTATETSVNGLRVQSRSADGTLSEPRWNPISVDGAEPTVVRSGGTDLGTPATFTARTRMAGVTEYVTTLNRDESTKQVIRPAADGSATFTYTPTKAGYNYVTVVARNAAGVQTEEGGTYWTVLDGPRITSTDFPTTSSGRLAPGTFTFTPRLAGTTAYEYTVNFGAYTRIAAKADGTATLTWTPPEAGWYYLTVRSLTAGGTRSANTQYNFLVESATVSSVAPAVVPPGAVRTITVSGTGLHPRDGVQVNPASGDPLTATVKTVSSDGTSMTVDVNLGSAPAGPASVTLRPYGGGAPVVLAAAFTINPPLALRATKAPAITGAAVVGGTLTAQPGEWTPSATSYRYQWSADGVPIKGATKATLRVDEGLLWKRLTVTVTAIRTGYADASAVSAATTKVGRGSEERPPPRPVVRPGTPWSDTRRPTT
ncbi:hypothetical protein O7634_08370 [Micromonospora sp. WMMD1120]|uniref:hypothetical protein n=1 Tax=Micromonospora sp. WMMD1120 TaxID=3016106 RepID=UPI002415E963|nr:hypothetical protein [Micromonospora sp. WMMD1120]MDG4806766.1 hypothetical protein [Micromonospora sp. WMMD1120]